MAVLPVAGSYSYLQSGTVEMRPQSQKTATPSPIGSALSDETKKSFDLALEAIKQLITLASAILVFTLTFVEKLRKPSTTFMWLTLTGAWLMLLLSILCGVLSLLQMTTAFVNKNSLFEPSVSSNKIAVPVVLQIILFLLALSAFIAYVSYVSCCLPQQ